jgi:hypothetical protein
MTGAACDTLLASHLCATPVGPAKTNHIRDAELGGKTAVKELSVWELAPVREGFAGHRKIIVSTR